MELEKKHYYIGAAILVLGLIALKWNLDERKRLRIVEASATLQAVPNPLSRSGQQNNQSAVPPQTKPIEKGRN